MALKDRLRLLWLALTMKPIRGAEDAPPAAPPKDDPPEDPPEDKGGDKDDPPPEKTAEEWRKELRTYERNAKSASAKKDKELETLRKQLQEREDEDKSEHEKAIEAAKEEGRKAASTEAEKERRADRLEVAVTRLASKGVTIGEGDEAKTVRFDDPEDALVFVERQISRGDIDADEIYDDEGKVKSDAVTQVLADLLTDKPRLAADGDKPKPGDPDTRKGDPAKSDLEHMTPEDHAKRKYPAKK